MSKAGCATSRSISAVIDASLLRILGQPSPWTQAVTEVIGENVQHWERAAIADHLLLLRRNKYDYDYDSETRMEVFHFDIDEVPSLVAYLVLLKHPIIYGRTWVCDGLMGEEASAETNFAHNINALSIEDQRRWLYYSELSCSRLVYGTGSDDGMRCPSFDIAMGMLREIITYALEGETNGTFRPGTLPLLHDLGIALPTSITDLPFGPVQEWHSKKVQRLLQDGLSGHWSGYICGKHVLHYFEAKRVRAEIKINNNGSVTVTAKDADQRSWQLKGLLHEAGSGDIKMQT